MKIAVFSARPYDRESLDEANRHHGHELSYFDAHLTGATVGLANGCDAISPFVNDELNRGVIERLSGMGVRLLTLRSAGFNHVDLRAAEANGVTVTRVPAYSPYAVAEHAVALLLTLNRNTHRAYNRTREANFSLVGLLGYDLHGKTVGVVGTGKIGAVFTRIMKGFGCRVLAHDPHPNPEVEALEVPYLPLKELFAEADIVALHLPLTPQTHHLIDRDALRQMKGGVVLINTSRGGLIDTPAVIGALKSGKLGGLGLDVYEEEADLFFEDLSGAVLQDDVFARLLTFPNVLITGHQGFFTREALANIAEATLANATHFENGEPENTVTVADLA